jgi:hypothetical protein
MSLFSEDDFYQLDQSQPPEYRPTVQRRYILPYTPYVSNVPDISFLFSNTARTGTSVSTSFSSGSSGSGSSGAIWSPLSSPYSPDHAFGRGSPSPIKPGQHTRSRSAVPYSDLVDVVPKRPPRMNSARSERYIYTYELTAGIAPLQFIISYASSPRTWYI